ncbi:hypothetical protein AM593_10139, partial [Mytilus galloprovincialis]
MEIGNVSERQQPYHSADNSRRPSMGLQCIVCAMSPSKDQTTDAHSNEDQNQNINIFCKTHVNIAQKQICLLDNMSGI